MNIQEKEYQVLAEHLASMSYKKARNAIRQLDTSAKLKYWRNSVHNEWHTRYELPDVGLCVTLIEIPERTSMPDSHLLSVEPIYVEARVEALKT